MSDRELLTSLREKISSTLLPLLQGAKRVALIDFPNHSNVGDSMIWLGQYQFLIRHGIEVTYVCSPSDYSEKNLRSCTDDNSPILILGGGNLGDLWTTEQDLRELVISQFHDRRVIQLPQSIHFQHQKNIERARQVFDAHPDFHVLVRDRNSQQLARDQLGRDATLCPDMALCLPDLKYPDRQHDGVVWLGRNDKERSDERRVTGNAKVEECDWVTDQYMPSMIWQKVLRRLDMNFGTAKYTMTFRKLIYLKLAEKRLKRGIEIVSRGGGLVTERLHGHILAVLLDIPHVVIDNVYGKTLAFHEAWTDKSALAYFASSREDAIVHALSAQRKV